MNAAAAVLENPHRRSADVDIAVLQVQYSNIEEKVSDLKLGMKDIQDSIIESQRQTSRAIKDLGNRSEEAHVDLSEKIAHLEKWKWMLVGGGMVIGSIGWQLAEHWETLSKFLK